MINAEEIKRIVKLMEQVKDEYEAQDEAGAQPAVLKENFPVDN